MSQEYSPCPTCDGVLSRGEECTPCRARARAERTAARLRKEFQAASKVTAHDGLCVSPGSDDNFASLDAWLDDPERPCGEVDGVRFVWATQEHRERFQIKDRIEWWLEEEHHEDAGEQVDWDKVAAAQAMVDEALAGVVSYVVDTSVAVILPTRSGAQ